MYYEKIEFTEYFKYIGSDEYGNDIYHLFLPSRGERPIDLYYRGEFRECITPGEWYIMGSGTNYMCNSEGSTEIYTDELHNGLRYIIYIQQPRGPLNHDGEDDYLEEYLEVLG